MTHTSLSSVSRVFRLLGVVLSATAAVWLLTAGLATAAPPAQTGTVYHVDDSAASGGDGLAWTTAFTALQTALDTAVSGDEIWVAAGLYTPTKQVVSDNVRTKTFSLTAGVQLYGGFAGTETDRDQRDFETNLTVLSGDVDHDDTADGDGILHNAGGIVDDNVYNVVLALDIPAESNTRLDGFVITGGDADGAYDDPATPYPCDWSCGGGIKNHNADVHYANLVVRGNWGKYGGGIYNNGSSAEFTNVYVVGNTGATEGSGIKNTDSPIVLSNVTIVGNTYSGIGAGSGIASFGGGTDMHIVNSTIAFNSAFHQGGGILNKLYTHVYMTNTIVWGNISDDDDFNQIYTQDDWLTEMEVAHSLISGTAAYTGTGNMTGTMSPFVRDASPGTDGTWGTADDDYGDMRMRADAVTRDTGLTAALWADAADLDRDGDTAEATPLDADYRARVAGTSVDMGSFELQILPVTVTAAADPADLTLSWTAVAGCTYDVYRSTTAYSGYTQLAADVSVPYTPAHTAPVEFFRVEEDCPTGRAVSYEYGHFDFAVTPGDGS